MKRTLLSAVRLDVKPCRIPFAEAIAVLLGENRVKPWYPLLSASKKDTSPIEFVDALKKLSLAALSTVSNELSERLSTGTVAWRSSGTCKTWSITKIVRFPKVVVFTTVESFR